MVNPRKLDEGERGRYHLPVAEWDKDCIIELIDALMEQ
jgi:hypothetical protein